MVKLPFIEIAELNKELATSDNFENLFSIADLNIKENISEAEGFASVRMNALLLILVLEGKASIEIDYIPYTIESNDFITIMPAHIIQPLQLSPDFKGKIIVAAKSFMEECRPSKRPPSMTHYMRIKKNPRLTLLPEETRLLDTYIEKIREKIRLQSHNFRKEVIQNAFIAFSLEFANIVVTKAVQDTSTELTRKEELFEQFLQLLIKHCREEHLVTFYAEKLCITPQYLSLILKKTSGKSANKWIDDALIAEAKILLKAPQATVQQVADTLCFSDQSTFGKFFKKHMGISPVEYRRRP